MKKLIILTIVLFTVQFLALISAQTEQKPELVVQTGHSGVIQSAIFSPDGTIIASNGDDGIIIWQTSTGRELRRITGLFSAIDFSPDSKDLVASQKIEDSFNEQNNNPRLVEIFNISNGDLLKQFPTHTKSINSIKFSPDGNFILTASDDKTAKLWDVSNGSLNRNFVGHKTAIRKAIFSSDNLHIATVGGERNYENDSVSIVDSTARVWDISTGKEIQKFVHEDLDSDSFDGIGDIVFSSNGKFLVTSAHLDRLTYSERSKTIRVWNLSNGNLVKQFSGSGAISSVGKYLLADLNEEPIDTIDKSVEIIDLSNMNVLTKIKAESNIAYVSLSPDTKYVLIATEKEIYGGSTVTESGENSLTMFDVLKGNKLMKLEGRGKISGFSSRNSSFIKPLNDNSVLIGNYLWNFSNGTQMSLENVDYRILGKGDIYRPPLRVVSRDGKLLAMDYEISAESENEPPQYGIKIWETETGQQIQNLKETAGFSAWFTPDNLYFLVEYASGVELWDIKKGKRVWSKELIDDYTNYYIKNLHQDNGSCALSPNGKYILIRKSDKTLTLYETITGKVIWEIKQEMSDVVPGIFFSNNNLSYITPIRKETKEQSDDYTGFFDLKTHKEIARFEGELLFSNNENVLFGFQNKTKRNVLVDKNTGKIISELPINSSEPNFGWGIWNANGFSTDNKFFLGTTGKGLSIYDISSGKKITDLTSADFQDAVFYKQDNLILISNLNGSTQIWNAAANKEICKLVSLNDGTWIVTTPDGHFDTSKLENPQGLHWIMPDSPFSPLSFEVFMRDYYEPNLLPRLLKCNEENTCDHEFKPVRNLTELNRTQPKVKITGVKATASADIVQVMVEAEDAASEFQKDERNQPLHSGVFDVQLFRDGQLVDYSTSDAKLQETFRTYQDFDEELRVWREANKVELANGKKVFTFNVRLPKNRDAKDFNLTAYAFNADRVKSETARLNYAPSKPLPRASGNTYLITIGVNASENTNYNLRYAANDARLLQTALSKRLPTDKYRKIVQIPLISDYDSAGKLTENNATKAKIKAVLDKLSGKPISDDALKDVPNADSLEKVQPEDLVLIAFSGHGYADRNGIFYLVPEDIGAGGSGLSEILPKAISSDELSLWLRDVDAGEMLMIVDACHSAAAVQGAGFKPGPMGARGLGQLSYDKGMRILTATQADNVALELGSLQQGLLTYSLVKDGLELKQADYQPKDNQLFSSEWLGYAVKDVPALYGKIANGEMKDLLIDGIKPRGSVSVNLSEPKSNLNLQQPSLFDFSRRDRQYQLMTLP